MEELDDSAVKMKDVLVQGKEGKMEEKEDSEVGQLLEEVSREEEADDKKSEK